MFDWKLNYSGWTNYWMEGGWMKAGKRQGKGRRKGWTEFSCRFWTECVRQEGMGRTGPSHCQVDQWDYLSCSMDLAVRVFCSRPRFRICLRYPENIGSPLGKHASQKLSLDRPNPPLLGQPQPTQLLYSNFLWKKKASQRRRGPVQSIHYTNHGTDSKHSPVPILFLPSSFKSPSPQHSSNRSSQEHSPSISFP